VLRRRSRARNGIIAVESESYPAPMSPAPSLIFSLTRIWKFNPYLLKHQHFFIFIIYSLKILSHLGLGAGAAPIFYPKPGSRIKITLLHNADKYSCFVSSAFTNAKQNFSNFSNFMYMPIFSIAEKYYSVPVRPTLLFYLKDCVISRLGLDRAHIWYAPHCCNVKLAPIRPAITQYRYH
jgi:hypothetical protein